MASSSQATIAVTGAGGHLGRALVGRLRASGAQVIGLSSSGEPHGRRFRLEEPPAADLLAGADILVHTAWDQSVTNEDDEQSINVDGSLRLLDLAATNGMRVVFVSSLAAYEGTRSAYGLAKRAVERAVAERGGLSIRAGLIFGPDVGGMFAALSEQVASRRIVPVVHSPGRVQLVHRDDLVAILAEVALSEPAPAADLLVVAHPAAHSLGEVVATLARAQRRAVVRVPVPWKPLHLALRGAERTGAHLPFRSDSVLSLARSPAAAVEPAVAERTRPFSEATAVAGA